LAARATMVRLYVGLYGHHAVLLEIWLDVNVIAVQVDAEIRAGGWWYEARDFTTEAHFEKTDT